MTDDLKARAENDRLRADAQAAVAMAMEKAAEVVKGLHEKLCTAGHPTLMLGQVTTQTLALEAAIRDLADIDGLAVVEALRFRASAAHMIIATERAEVVRLRAENARLRADAEAAVRLVVERAADAELIEYAIRDAHDGFASLADYARSVSAEIRALAPVDGLAMVEALRERAAKAQDMEAERDGYLTDLGIVIMTLPTGQGMRSAGAVGGVKMLRADRDRLAADLAAAQAQIEALRVAPFPDESGFYGLIGDAMREAEKAMRKFPQPNYVISKVAEEAGEVVKAAIHCAEGRETAENLRGEMKQLIAMLYRLWVEGDDVHGLPSVRAALAALPAKEGE